VELGIGVPPFSAMVVIIFWTGLGAPGVTKLPSQQRRKGWVFQKTLLAAL